MVVAACHSDFVFWELEALFEFDLTRFLHLCLNLLDPIVWVLFWCQAERFDLLLVVKGRISHLVMIEILFWQREHVGWACLRPLFSLNHYAALLVRFDVRTWWSFLDSWDFRCSVNGYLLFDFYFVGRWDHIIVSGLIVLVSLSAANVVFWWRNSWPGAIAWSLWRPTAWTNYWTSFPFS